MFNVIILNFRDIDFFTYSHVGVENVLVKLLCDFGAVEYQTKLFP